EPDKLQFSHKVYSEYLRAELRAFESFGSSPNGELEKLLSRASAPRDKLFLRSYNREEMDFVADLMAEKAARFVDAEDARGFMTVMELVGGAHAIGRLVMFTRMSSHAREKTSGIAKEGWFLLEYLTEHVINFFGAASWLNSGEDILPDEFQTCIM